MAQGKKYSDEIKEKGYAMLLSGQSVMDVAKSLGLPYTTVKTWQKKFDNEDEFVNLRNERKAKFVTDAWELIDKGNKLLSRRLNRALTQEDNLDEILEELSKDTLLPEARRNIKAKIEAMKIENINQVSTMIGTMYDKQALANNEATERVENIIRKFEDF